MTAALHYDRGTLLTYVHPASDRRSIVVYRGPLGKPFDDFALVSEPERPEPDQWISVHVSMLFPAGENLT